MSGLPVFVIDAQGTPLMPMAAAYARVLLQRGRASRVPHHAFTILQLEHSIAAPVFRSVILGVSLRSTVIELFLLVEGRRDPLPLLYIVVDFLWQAGQQTVYQEPGLHYQLLSRNEASDHAVTSVISALRAFVPISHALIVPTDGDAELVTPSVGLQASLLSVTNSQITVSLQEALRAFTVNPIGIPKFIVTVVAHRQPSEPTLPRHEQIEGKPSNQTITIGTLCMICAGKNKSIGIIDPMDNANRPTLMVPQSVSRAGIVWQRNKIKSGAAIHVLSCEQVIFLPAP